MFVNVNLNLEERYDDISFPKMIKVKQKFNDEKIGFIKEAVLKELEKVDKSTLKGKKIGITAGSRGIKGWLDIIYTLKDFLVECGAVPIIIPSMGSHGGANAKGQKDIVKSYGLNEDDFEIISTMDTRVIGNLKDGTELHFSTDALNLDGIILMNKIKPHADYKGDFESGLLKMACIGLGKHKGALTLHDKGFHNFKAIIPEAGNIILENSNIIFGIAIVENAYDDPMLIEVIEKKDIFQREKELLKIAKANMPRIKLKEVDILVIDEIGKNISGEGMDPNVTGRPGSYLYEGFDHAPPVNKIIIRDITDVSHGNAAGIGMADLTTKRVVDKIDFIAMYTNSITAAILGPSRLPVVLNNEKDCM
ncbi:MAG: hypothetical protein MJA31_06715, partial [Clostridia bacterium]|nr:hypothetical protein [Clostridia bacterium]